MAFIPGWNQKPFGGISLSAGGLLALADLQTIAQRTAITGGASWMDALLLCPGLHYQQAADELFRRGGAAAIVDIVDESGGNSVHLKLNNAATANYIQKIAKPGETVTLNVGRLAAGRGRYKLRRSDSGYHATAWRESGSSPGLGWVSHVLYLMVPVLTLSAITFIVLFRDWWTLASIMGLMTSRVLNIWVIKQRASHGNCPNQDDGNSPLKSPTTPTTTIKPPNNSNPTPSPRNRNRTRRLSLSQTRQRLTQLLITLESTLGPQTLIRLRGRASDLRAVTTQHWLRGKTHAEGYLEAAAKLIVYLVAALSGNMTQAGALIMMVLLLASAGLLALSNAKARALAVNGRVAVAEDKDGGGDGVGKGGGGGGSGGRGKDVGVNTTERMVVVERGRTGQRRQPATAAADAMNMGLGGGGSTSSLSSAGGRVVGGNPADLAERGQAGGGHIKWAR